MKKYTVIFIIVIVFIFTSALMSHTEAEENCGSNYSSQCEHLGSGPECPKWTENCMKECLENDPPDVPSVVEPTPINPSESKFEKGSFNLYAKEESQDSYTLDEKVSRSNHSDPLIVAQNENYVPCYKDVNMKPVRFRWCPTGKPWTATNEQRNFCYATSEDCAKAEMPQSWCIKCGSKD